MGARRSVSVALSTWNGERHLPAQLDSLARQSLIPTELVVRDDASADGTVSVLERFATEAPFPVRIEVGSERLGPVGSFERVLRSASGDVVALCDQDDVWQRDKLATLVPLVGPTRAALAFGDATLIDTDGVARPGRLSDHLGLRGARRRRFDTDPLAALLERSLVAGCTAVVRADVVAAGLPFGDEVSAEGPAPMLHDRWLSLLAAALGPVAVIDRPVVGYRQHPGQHTASQVGTGRRLRNRAGTAVRALAQRDGQWPERLSARASQLAVLAERAAARHADPGRVAQLASAAEHFGRRAGLPADRRSRVLVVARELEAGRYRFSDGRLAAVADLVRRRD